MPTDQITKDRAFNLQAWCIKQKAELDEMPPYMQSNIVRQCNPDQVEAIKWYIDMGLKPQIHFNNDYSKIWIGIYV